MPDEDGAIWIPNNNFFPNRDGYKPAWIVLHGTAGGTSAVAIARYFASTQGTANPVSSHYIVGTDGTVVQCVSEKDGAWANGYVSGKSGTSGDGYGNGYHDSWWDSGINPNLLTISIEHVKSAIDNSSQLTAIQQRASFALILHICMRHNIPRRKADANGGITGHYAIDPLNRSNCPGAYPWDKLWQFLAGATPMTTLEGFPMVSQLDGDTNAQFDCVPASIAAALEYLTKRPYTSAQVKDVVYGKAYRGNTDPARYVDYCTQQGVLLWPVAGADNEALIQTTKQQLAQGHPVLLTEVDPYMPAGSGETHVVVAYACDADSITAMDPYIDAPVTRTDQQWLNDLRSNQVWIMENIQEDAVLTIDQASDYFIEITPGQRWRCKQTNVDIAYGILNYYCSCTKVGLNGLSQYGLPLSGEEGVPNTKQAVLQRFERGVIMYDPDRELDRVPGLSSACYPAHIDKGPGQDPRIAQLQDQVAQLQAQIAALQKQEATQLPKQWYDALLPLKPLVDTLS
jgi:N-acetyl-anhydromuramyl-L-alanine amidase AmpD